MKMNFWSFMVICCLIPISLQDCIWYGECNKENGKIQNCLADDSSPRRLQNETEGLQILREKCSIFLEQFPDKRYCCDNEQLKSMLKNMNYAAGIFGRCPTCLTNLNQHICLMTCSPNQTDYMEVVNVSTNNEGKKYITEVNFYISQKYKEATYNSCKEVSVPSTGGKAVDISCGEYGPAKQCTAERWFSFFGNFKDNIVAPFDIHYVSLESDKFTTLDIKVLDCNESYPFSKQCSCNDCEASCSFDFKYSEASKPYLIGNMNGITFIIEIALLIFSSLVLVFLIRHHCFSETAEKSEETFQKVERSKLKKCGFYFKQRLEKLFTEWGTVCAKNPTLVLCLSACMVFALSYGIKYLRITTDPIEIWSSPASESRIDKTFFDTRFTPFYRTNQIFVKTKGLLSFNWTSPDNNTYQFGPAFNVEFLEAVYYLQMRIQKLGSEDGRGLEKICFAPVKNEFFPAHSVDYCTVQSVWGYLQNDVSLCKNDTSKLYLKLQRCLRNNYDPSCLAPYGGPVFSPLAVGGHLQKNQTEPHPENYLLATGLTLTFLANNAVEESEILNLALAWEAMFINFLEEWSKTEMPDFMEIAFSAERSIQDEIERESKAEMTTILVSYMVMFLYITVSLSRIRGFSSLLVETKFTLGLGGIIIVLTSVSTSLGVFGYLRVPTTLLTIEVIPFLVLAIGVDNIFILFYTYQEYRAKTYSVEENIGRVLGRVGPSILLTTLSEVACFLIGTLSHMPAIKTFSEYSSLAVTVNFLLQISSFVSILALDSKREQNNLADLLCFIKLKEKKDDSESTSILKVFFKYYYGPFLMKPWIRVSVIMIFLFWIGASIGYIPLIEKGLDQELSMPQDSYMVDYFQFMKDLLSIGPPVYFVIKNGLNFTDFKEVNAVCGSVGCDNDSLVTYLTKASKYSDISYIAKSPSSWIDDYFDWLLNSKECCKKFPQNESFCPHHIQECESCYVNIQNWRPTSNDFNKYLPFFLKDNPDLICSKAGHAAYAGGVNYEINIRGEMEVKDNYFMTYHTSLRTSSDYYLALHNGRSIAKHLSGMLSTKLNRTVEVFAYSVFYVYYEQYLTVVQDALISLSLSLIAVFGMTYLLSGFDFGSSTLVLFVVMSIIVNMTGLMCWWNISLNAVSLVNLIVSAGIGVEFCSHIIHAFGVSGKEGRKAKVQEAITTIGVSVFSGITLTKFLGIIVLAFAQTLMLRTFYFKMYLGIVLIGASHGLILMPVLLSYLG